MLVNVVGLGYIGLPTALMMAANGVSVVGVDYNEKLVATLNENKITFEENGLQELFDAAVSAGIRFSNKYVKADVYIVSVPTPYDKDSKKIDPNYILKAVDAILDVCGKGAIIAIESTISPGTIDRFVRPAIAKRGFVLGKDVHIAHVPERIIPGNMLFELKHNARVVGADDVTVGETLKAVYSSFCESDIVITSIRTAEMSKVVENTFRDINIAYANELAKICRSDNMDVYEIIRIANMHPRVNILTPGPGVGGHCISVDPWFLVGDYPGLANLILSARKINDGMPRFVIHRISEIMKAHGLTDVKRVGLYGLTYKENVDDVRESPTLQMLERLDDGLAGGLVQVYDPYVTKDIVPNQHHDLKSFLDSVDMVVLMVGHDEIKENFDLLQNKVVFDTRNVCHLPGVEKL